MERKWVFTVLLFFVPGQPAKKFRLATFMDQTYDLEVMELSDQGVSWTPTPTSAK